jgi:RNA polymerase sigma factor (sigma-70 family)
MRTGTRLDLPSDLVSPSRKISGAADDGGIYPRTASKLQTFDQVMLPHLDAAYNLARWLTRNDEDARDVVQEAYLRAFRFFDTFRGGDGKPWLLEVVRNTCRTWQRRRNRELGDARFDEVEHSLERTEPNQEDAAAGLEQTAVLRRCIEALPMEFREVLVLRELEELSYREIAESTGLAPGTVMSRLSRARKRLAACAERGWREAHR